MRDSDTDRDSLADALPDLDGVVRKDADRNSSLCSLEHRKPNASYEIWIDAEGRIGICCHDCGGNRELRQRVVIAPDDTLGRLAGEVLTWATT